MGSRQGYRKGLGVLNKPVLEFGPLDQIGGQALNHHERPFGTLRGSFFWIIGRSLAVPVRLWP